MKKLVTIIAVVIVSIVFGTGLVLAQKKTPVAAPAAAVVPLPQLLEQVNKAEAAGDKQALKQAYSKIVNDHPDYDNVEQIQQKLGELNLALILTNAKSDKVVVHQVDIGDSLGKLAKQYGTTKELIKRRNNLKSDVIRVGQKLSIWTAPFSISVDKSQNTLILRSGDEVVKTFRCSTGKDNSTPVGKFTIANKIEKPVWFKPGSAPVPPESPENELGTRWMGFGEDPHYGIHGTIRPDQIGTQATAGCVRLTNEEVEMLYDMVPAGTKVTIQD